NGERVELVSADGTKLVGWYLAPKKLKPPRTSPTSRGLLWFYGNGETVAAIWPIVREFQPPGTAVLVLDYPGYGGSGGRATEGSLYAAADAAYAALATRPGVDPQRIYVYGRSLGSAVATHTAARRPVAGLIVESPFTNAAAMAKHHYRLLPTFLLRLSLDHLAHARLRTTAASSPSANLELCATRPVARRSTTSARVTSQRSTSGSVCPATSSSSNSGKLHSSLST